MVGHMDAFNVDTTNNVDMDVSNIDNSNVDHSINDHSNVDVSNVDIYNIDVSNIDVSNIAVSNIDVSNVDDNVDTTTIINTVKPDTAAVTITNLDVPLMDHPEPLEVFSVAMRMARFLNMPILETLLI
jgi:hypothetical protein